MAKLGPPYLQKQLKECAAFHVMAEKYKVELQSIMAWLRVAFLLFILFRPVQGIMLNSGRKHLPRWNFRI
jgi:hypothetical protein